jgi:hypothetical protein
MRVLFAGLFVFVGLIAGLAFLGWLSPDLSSWFVGPGMLMVFFASLVVASLAFNQRTFTRLSVEEQAKRITEHEEKGWLVEQEFIATRAFQIEEFEHEGSSYFLELSDGRVLFMTGQYLYDYEDEPRRFPNRHFLVSRYRFDHSVERLKCSAEVLEVDGIAPPYFGDDYAENVPQDGAILDNVTYDQIFSRWMQNREK